MTERTCPICGEKFTTTHSTKKYCSEACVNEAWRRYMRNRARLKYKTDASFKDRNANASTVWRRNHRERYNTYQRDYLKRHRKRNREKRRQEVLDSLSKEELSFLRVIAKKQQTFVYTRKSRCEVPNCKTHTKNLVLHEVKYSPIETVTLCSRHHAILHHCLLGKKKVRVRINES